MTPSQFAALASLTRWPADGPVINAMRLVLVEGHTQAEAARLTGALPAAISRAMRRARQVREAAQVLAALTPDAAAAE